ncbi:MAG: 8-oxoguanine DNA glycosylase [Firmicutes bacterium]|nr:8-oxoguanine DNA glycosylase [Bacillota bacterium]
MEDIKKYTFREVACFDPAQTFDCGQCFRWTEEADLSWTGVAWDHVANVKAVPSECGSSDKVDIIVEGTGTEEFWRNYLDLDSDYAAMSKALMDREPEIMPGACEAGRGIRILRQDFWEATLDFIISQNNNIPRIKGCIEKLSEKFGKPLGEFRGRERYGLPAPETLAGLSREDLADVHLGYRDEYIIKTASQWLEMTEEERKASVIDFPGIGPKVESCIRLFGLHEMEAFPIDVWVARLMNRFYGFEERDKKGMKAFADERFGALAGLAQQYLFYYIRGL